MISSICTEQFFTEEMKYVSSKLKNDVHRLLHTYDTVIISSRSLTTKHNCKTHNFKYSKKEKKKRHIGIRVYSTCLLDLFFDNSRQCFRVRNDLNLNRWSA
jgi:hypothetical protein